jgi:tRNA dimethylallyltransferase
MPPLIVVLGETASGKSSLAIQLAQQYNGEIICADSWTVYKYFDIGTAKPSQHDRSMVPHHLLDIAEPEDGFSAAIFKRLAVERIAEVSTRGRLPIMVGGTGLYIDSVLYDYQFLPPPAMALRSELSGLSLEQLLQKAAGMGLETSGIDTANKRRVIRLIENNGLLPERRELRSNTLLLGLSVEREELEQRMVGRTDAMLEAGLEAEVRSLAERYGWDTEPMKGIGYREFQPYISGEQSLPEVRQAIIRDTMALAKKQRTWFRRNKSIHWLTTEDKLSEAVDYATTFLNK